MKGKKALLAGLLNRSGCLRLLRSTARGRLVIFNYHRIRPDGRDKAGLFDDGVFGPTVSTFAQQVAWLRRQTRVLSEDELLHIVQSGRVPDGLSTMITFDDGYRDNFTLAFPVLQRLGVPALFFIPTESIEARRLGWWDIIAYLIKQTRESHFEMDGRRFDLLRRPRSKIIRDMQRLMKLRPAQMTGSLVDRLATACKVSLPDVHLQDREIMTWEHIRVLAQRGYGIGSHTHTHRVLATLSAEEQEDELRRSRSILDRQVGRRVHSIAYPVGGYQHFTRETQALAAQCGYRLGFSFNTFVNHWGSMNCFDVRRIEEPRGVNLLAAAAILPGLFARWD